jgi:hypothetical protein
VRLIRYKVECWGSTHVEAEQIWKRAIDAFWERSGVLVQGLPESGMRVAGNLGGKFTGFFEVPVNVTFDDGGVNIAPVAAKATIWAHPAEIVPAETPPLVVEAP